MSFLWALQNIIHEMGNESEDNTKLIKDIEEKYMDLEKNELLCIAAHEENIKLIIDIGYLEPLYEKVNENKKAQYELDSLLNHFYKEHLKASLEFTEADIEKIYRYDSLKAEIDAKETITFYQNLYNRKMDMAKKMEERPIVQKFRLKEENCAKIEKEKIILEEKIQKLKDFSKEIKEKTQLLYEVIYRVVKNSKDLQNMKDLKSCEHLPSDLQILGNEILNMTESVKGIIPHNKNPHSGGLSSRLTMNYSQLKVPAIQATRKMCTFDPFKGLNRLLQESKAVYKSLEASTIRTNNDKPTLELVLKDPLEILKPEKSVNFEIKENDSTPFESMVKEHQFNYPEKIVTLPNEKPSQDVQKDPELTSEKSLATKAYNLGGKENQKSKRKLSNNSPQPSKKKRVDSFVQLSEGSFDLDSKDVLDMFLGITKNSSTSSAPIVEVKKNVPELGKNVVNFEDNEFVSSKSCKNVTKEKKISTSKSSAADFDNFLSEITENESVGNGKDLVDESFDFFNATENDGEAGDDIENKSFSFNF